MQRKTEKLRVVDSKLEMEVNVQKTKALKVISKVSSPIPLGCKDIETVGEFCHVASIISTDDGGADKDISVRIGKARHAFLALRSVWLSKQFPLNIKLSEDIQHKREIHSSVWL